MHVRKNVLRFAVFIFKSLIRSNLKSLYCLNHFKLNPLNAYCIASKNFFLALNPLYAAEGFKRCGTYIMSLAEAKEKKIPSARQTILVALQKKER